MNNDNIEFKYNSRMIQYFKGENFHRNLLIPKKSFFIRVVGKF